MNFNYEELAWFNQQLAAMVREGLPMSGALKQLTQTQEPGRLRETFEKVERAMSRGISLEQAVGEAQLPPVYISLVRAGIRSGDLPRALTMAADYYQDVHQLWRRTKAILFYPIVVAVTGVGLCFLLGRMASFAASLESSLYARGDANHAAVSGSFATLMTIPLILVGLMSVVAVALLNSKSRNWLVWKMPGFREARVAQVAGGLGMMLGNGSSLPEALELAGQFEGSSAAGRDLALWKRQLAAGQSDLGADPSNWEAMPVLLAWFMRSARGDLGEGFRRASVYYRDRAVHRLDLLINGAMPALVLFLGSVILCQGVIAIRALIPTLQMLIDFQ